MANEPTREEALERFARGHVVRLGGYVCGNVEELDRALRSSGRGKEIPKATEPTASPESSKGDGEEGDGLEVRSMTGDKLKAIAEGEKIEFAPEVNTKAEMVAAIRKVRSDRASASPLADDLAGKSIEDLRGVADAEGVAYEEDATIEQITALIRTNRTTGDAS